MNAGDLASESANANSVQGSVAYDEKGVIRPYRPSRSRGRTRDRSHNTVHHTGAHPSYLKLPVAPKEGTA